MKIKRFGSIIASVALSAALMFSGCKNTPPDDKPDSSNQSSAQISSSISSDQEISSAAIIPSTRISIRVGDKYDLTKLDDIDKECKFSLSPDTLADVTTDGMLEAVAEGELTVSVYDSDGKAIAVVNVAISGNGQSSDEEESKSGEDSKSSETENTITPTVWQVSDKDGNIIYMMGSIHAADDSIKHMPDYFEAAFEKCDSLAVECDTTEMSSTLSATMKYTNQLLYTDGTTIKDHISTEAYQNGVKILQAVGTYSSVYDLYKPAMWASLLENAAITNAGLDSQNGVDVTLIKRAKSEGKNILEIESVESQIKLLADMPEEIQNLMIEAYGEENSLKTVSDQLIELYDMWKSGTITEDAVLGDTNEENMTEEQKKLVQEYNDLMLNNRNVGMVEKAKEYMASGDTVFFMVGSAHFYGEKGIVELLKADGCTFRKLESTDAAVISEKPAEI